MLFQITWNFILCYSLYNSIIKVLVYDRCSGCSMRVFEFFLFFLFRAKGSTLILTIYSSELKSLRCDLWNPIWEVTHTHCCTVIYGTRYEKSQTRLTPLWYVESDTRSHRHALLNCDMWNPVREVRDTHCCTVICGIRYEKSQTRLKILLVTVTSNSKINCLIHWGRVMQICVSKLTIIASDNGLAPGSCQAIIWTNDGMLLVGLLWRNFNKISIEIHTFSLKKIHLKMSSASGKWRPFCLGSQCIHWIVLRIKPQFIIETYCVLESKNSGNQISLRGFI